MDAPAKQPDGAPSDAVGNGAPGKRTLADTLCAAGILAFFGASVLAFRLASVAGERDLSDDGRPLLLAGTFLTFLLVPVVMFYARANALAGRSNAPRFVVLAVLLGFHFVCLCNGAYEFGRVQGHSKMVRERSDLRSLATALESYRVDQGTYPVGLAALVKPGSSLPSVPTSVFGKHLPAHYQRDAAGRDYCVWLAGPDEAWAAAHEPELDAVFAAYLAQTDDAPTAEARSVTYDASNGTSAGVVWRSSRMDSWK